MPGKHMAVLAASIVCGLLFGAFMVQICGQRREASQPDKRGIMSCMVGETGISQVVSYVPGWEPPESWRCAVAMRPVEWRADDRGWKEGITIELGKACGWGEPASACCPECLAWECGCPSNPGGCHGSDAR